MRQTTGWKGFTAALLIAGAAWIAAPGGPARAQAPAPTAAGAADLKPEALRQIDSLMREKRSRTPVERKIDSQLLYAYKMQTVGRITPEVRELRVDLARDAEDRVRVELQAAVTPRLLRGLESLGAEIVHAAAEYDSVLADIPLEQLERIAARDDVRRIARWVAPALQVGAVTSEGDVRHRADVVRAIYGATGALQGTGQNVKIGVISDSFDTAVEFCGFQGCTPVQRAAVDVAGGDLPGPGNPFGHTMPVQVVGPGVDPPPQTGFTPTDEGRAMLQIVHDLVPDAELYFSSGVYGPAAFAQSIDNLRAAGCQIVVDDLLYFNAGVFQDDVIAAAVDAATAQGVLYLSAAGNQGNLNDGTSGVWEGDFAGGLASPFGTPGGTLQQFGATPYNRITSPPPSEYVALKWSDPLGSSANDYDLFITDAAGTTVTGSSTDVQDGLGGNDLPLEAVSGPRQSGELIYVVRNAGAAVRALHLNTLGGMLQVATNGQTFGHSAAAGAVSVAATSARANSGIFNGDESVETFSSDGPRRVFYDANGNAYTPGNVLFGTNGGVVRQKPDVTAADAVTTTLSPRFAPFSGTSAAAPHAAAIAAQVLSRLPGLSADDLRDALISSALDIEAPGTDRDSGRGVARSDLALETFGLSLVDLSPVESTIVFNNQNGVVEPGEVGWLSISLQNNLLESIGGIQATVTSQTPGVLVVNGSKSYGSIAPLSTATDPMAFRFVANRDVLLCGDTMTFTVTVTHSGVLSPQTFTRTVNLGTLPATIEANTGSPPPTSADYTVASGTTTDGVPICGASAPTECGTTRTCVRTFSSDGVTYHAYRFVNSNSTSQCVEAKMDILDGSATFMQVSAYNAAGYNPNLTAANQLADPGGAPTSPFRFQVPAGSAFTLVVTNRNETGGSRSYRLQVGLADCDPVACQPASPMTLSPANGTTFPGALNLPFSQQFDATGGTGFYDYDFLGSVPGLGFSENSVWGTLAGTPTAEGFYQVQMLLQDATGCADSRLQFYNVNVQGCVPGPQADPCDGIDNDCDGSTDEDHVPTSTTCGTGACQAAGQLACISGAVQDTCTPGSPSGSDFSCDDFDDDCDGANDEDFMTVDTTCGLGICASTGLVTCEPGGNVVDSCIPGVPEPSDATCDGLDNDCDGRLDDDYLATAADTDGDTVPDAIDVCPDYYDPVQSDADGDGLGDICDGCPLDGGKARPGICGCGVTEALGGVAGSLYLPFPDHQGELALGLVDDLNTLFVPRGDRVERYTFGTGSLGTFGSPGTGDGQFDGLVGIAVGGCGRIYTTEATRVQVFDAEGHHLQSFGTAGSGPGQLSGAQGIDVDSSGNVYVANTGNARIEIFDPAGAYAGTMGVGTLSSPRGLVVRNGRVYVADAFANRIFVFGLDGTPLGSVGDASGPGLLNLPLGVDVDASGSVYVTGIFPPRVSVFDAGGTFRYSFPPVNPSESIQGIAVADNGGIVIGQTSGIVTDNVQTYVQTLAESDGDGTPDCFDSCTDTDGDGFGDPGFGANTCAADCAAGDPDAWQPVAEVLNLRIGRPAGPTPRLTWDPVAPGATQVVYDVLLSIDPTALVCYQQDIEEAELYEFTAPAPGQAVYFLVGARNACGSGSLGTDSVGAERPNACGG